LRRPEPIVCPQGEGREPLYLVLSEFLPTFHGSGPFDSAGLDELFPKESAASSDPLALRDKLLIEVITADGEVLDSFGGNNVLSAGVIRDLNGDGTVERVDHTPYKVEGVDEVDVLNVWPVQQHSEPSLNVLYNWGDDEWGYQLADRDNDGHIEIELGPRKAEGIRPKVIFAWDPRRRAYWSASGVQGAHFRVLANGDPWKQFEGLKAEGLQFPGDSEAVPADRRADRIGIPRQETRIAPHSEPYVYHSLHSLDDSAVLRYMGEGARSKEIPPRPILTPPDLWSSSPRSAATGFVDRNRSPEHKQAYQVALDDRNGEVPPENGSIALHEASAPCYEASDWVWFLSARPGDSYLAYGSSSRAGTVFFNFVNTQPSFDLGYARVSEADARQILQTVWWLSRVRTKARRDVNVGGMLSTADGRGRLALRSADGRTISDVQGTLWAGRWNDRWTGEYDTDVFLNLAVHIVQTALPARLGPTWQTTRADCASGNCRRPSTAGPPNARGRALVMQDADQILAHFTPDGSNVPASLASLAVAAIADLRIESAAGRFQQLLRQLPSRDPGVRDATTVKAELDALVRPGKDGKGFEQAMASPEQMRTVMQELDRVRHGFDEAAGRERLRAALRLAVRQLGAIDDATALERWAKTEDPGWRFALARLRELDPAAYVRALEFWLGRSSDESRRQVFAALAEVDPARARALTLAAGPSSDLAVASFGVLAEAHAIPDEAKRIAAVLDLLRQPAIDWQERARAIDVLVPSEDPQRFPTKAIDAALLERLEPPAQDADGAYIVGAAARALARRGRVEAFDRLLQAWSASENRSVGSVGVGEIVGALVQLSQQGGPRERHLLAEALRARLRESHGFLSEIVLAIWAANFRELLPELERVATSSPDDIEGDQANTWRDGPALPVVDRFHVARKVAALWREEDAFTRARLLLAFARFEPMFATPERREQMKRGLASAAASLAQDQADRNRLLGFLESVEASVAEGPAWAEQTEALARLAREAFDWHEAR